jgi:hemolysin activation/secretion protein
MPTLNIVIQMNSQMAAKKNSNALPARRIVSLGWCALVASFVLNTHAAPVITVPGAGTTLRELTPTIKLPAASPALHLQAPAVRHDASGGEVITLLSIRFTGNTQYSNAALSAVLADTVGKTYDLAGLQGLTNRITVHYRNHGFAFARALLPVQAMTDGGLIIEIVEGRYGRIKATGDDKRAAKAQVFLEKLKPGEVIQGAVLERAALILADLPGFKMTPLIRPGQKVGTGDLDVNVERDKRYSGELGLDNYGNRYTGRSIGHLDLNIDSPFLLGDQLTLNTLYSEENMWLGAFNYSLPLGGSGLRANMGYAHIYYELGQEFARRKSYGTAKVSSAGLGYPIIRSQRGNLGVAATYQHKELSDSNDIVPSSNTNRSVSLPISFSFDRRDQLAGGGITYGALSWTHGDLTVASANRAIDSATAKTAGGFDKINLDFARLQMLSANVTLFCRVSAQWAGNNLDSSEKFGLGGVNGVRAYPSAEVYGDEGMLAQLEVRYAINNFAPYAFYDSGTLNINHTTWTAQNNKRSLAGAGVGLRFNPPHWRLDVSAAWRTEGTFSDVNQADTPMVWMSANYRF